MVGEGDSGGTGDGQSGDPCDVDADCAGTAACFEGTCVQQGEVRVSLSWKVLSDFDLHVRTPANIHLYFRHMEGGGGTLDVDDCVQATCRDNDGTHVENIFFTESASPGTYDVWVENFDGRLPGDFDIEVAGAVQEDWSGSLTSDEGASSNLFSFTW